MPTEKILLMGAGGHAKVVLDALILTGIERRDVDVADDSPILQGHDFFGASVRRPDECEGQRFHVAIGIAAVRERLHSKLEDAGRTPHGIVHPGAIVSPRAVLAGGIFVAAQAVVAPAARLGAAVIVNHGAVVDHDCVVDAFSHIAPNATLGGNVKIGRRVLIGAGANLLPGVEIGDDAVIGAGAVVRNNIPAGARWAGVPATSLDRKAK